jgi:hypothetical protein
MLVGVIQAEVILKSMFEGGMEVFGKRWAQTRQVVEGSAIIAVLRWLRL